MASTASQDRTAAGSSSAGTGIRIGCARVSADAQALTAQRDALKQLGVPPERISVDHGMTGTNRDRPDYAKP